jgi:hypothetical protein
MLIANLPSQQNRFLLFAYTSWKSLALSNCEAELLSDYTLSLGVTAHYATVTPIVQPHQTLEKFG